jgi:general secretion pathway protein D
MSRYLAAILSLALFLSAVAPKGTAAAGFRSPVASPTAQPPAVINLSIIHASRAAQILRSIYPHAIVRVDPSANAVIVIAPPDVVSGMRTIATGIDVKNPIDQTVDTFALHTVTPQDAIVRVHSLFPKARLEPAPNRTLMIEAAPQDISQIKAVLGAIDTAVPTPTPRPIYPSDAVRIMQGNSKEIARTVARAVPDVRVSVSGPQVLLSGPPDDVTHAKALIAQLDEPQPGVQYTQLYRLRYVDATSVAQLLQRSFRNIVIEVDKELNAITVYATAPVQQRIADAIDQLDQGPQPSGGQAGGTAGAAAPGEETVVNLKAAIPGANGGPSTSATDIAQAVTQALQQTAPDLHITVPANSTQLILSGSEYSIQQAKDLIAQLDVPQPLVVLDTEVLEIDEGVQKQLGLRFPTAALTTTYSEVPPTAAPDGSAGRLLGLQPLTRTPLSLGAELDFLVSNNQARILEDPRITTVSGHTASLRAGETVNILTTTGGGTGTVATTQVQSFQTGVTLDITPVVNDGNYITVTLHPSVNTVAAISSAGVPNIQTRDTTTTVGLRDGETIVIGGLIEDDNSRTVQKIPILGDLPLIGKLFQDTGVNHTRNELIVTVTPHIVRPGDDAGYGPPLPAIPTAAPLPTLAPGTTLPSPSRSQRAALRAVPTPARAPTVARCAGFNAGARFSCDAESAADRVRTNQHLHVRFVAQQQLCRAEPAAADILRAGPPDGSKAWRFRYDLRDYDDQRNESLIRSLADDVAGEFHPDWPGSMAVDVQLQLGRSS